LDTSDESNNFILQAAAFLVFANSCSQLDSLSLFNFFQTDLGIIISPLTAMSQCFNVSMFQSLVGMFLIVFTFVVISSQTSQSQRVMA